MKKKSIVALMICLMAGGIIAGCTGSSNDSHEDNTAEEISEKSLEEEDNDESGGTNISVDDATRKDMNIFLSNFSEAGLEKYDKDDPDLFAILRWAFIWTKINRDDCITYEDRPGSEFGTYEKISLDDLNSVTDKYLGFAFTEDTAADAIEEQGEDRSFSYENGYFYLPAADGEAYNNLSIISDVEDLGDNKLKLYYNDYSQDLDAYFEGKEINYSMTDEEASNDPEYEMTKSGYAIVSDDGSSYILEYLEHE